MIVRAASKDQTFDAEVISVVFPNEEVLLEI
jgi:hypothetical protein